MSAHGTTEMFLAGTALADAINEITSSRNLDRCRPPVT
jgi:hypothetical protein